MEPINEAVLNENESPSGGKRLKKGGKAPMIILCALVAVAAAAYLGLCAYVNTLQTFAPNRHINGVDVGGLTVAQAQEVLETTLPAQEVVVTDPVLQMQTSVTLADLGYTAECFVDDAAYWMEQQQQTMFLLKGWNYLCYWTGRYPGGYSWPDMDPEKLNAAAERVADFFSAPPIDGSYTLLEDDIRMTRFKDGRTVSKDLLKERLQDVMTYCKAGYTVEVVCETVPAKELSAQDVYDELAGEMVNAGYDSATDTITPDRVGVDFSVSAAQKKLDETEPGETVLLGAAVENPAVTAEGLKAVLFRDVLGECRTHVSGTAARINNVKLSAATINGYVMNTGDVFSYNEAVGQRTAANGYQPAPAYIRGETVDEIGGGICQTSSTLYLACLRGDLEITERYAHRYVPAYISWGMDATVSWGGPDYKFTNQYEYPIKIVTEYSKGYLTVKILGTNVDGRYAKVTNEVLSTTPWETVYEEDPLLPAGTPESVKTTPYTGYKVKTYHTIYDKDGKVIDSHFEATSDYKVRNKVIVRPPAAVPQTPSVPAAGTVPDVPATGGGAAAETVPDVPAEPAVPTEPEIPEEPQISAEESVAEEADP